jgi:hypothetical protein
VASGRLAGLTFGGTQVKVKNIILLTLALLTVAISVNAQSYSVAETRIFTPQHKKVLLLKKSGAEPRKIILFQTMLRVNTDGAATSYHPLDPRGREIALNNVCNAIAVRRLSNLSDNLCLSNFGKAISVFEQFRDNDWRVPAGFRITWDNVLPATIKEGRKVPCIFQSGEYKGYFGSLTALKNDLPTAERGECEADNQINSLKIPALVLAGGANPLKAFGAMKGDLLVAYNPKTELFTSAIIGDTGPPDNLGEGSVALNMILRGTTTVPKKKSETFGLNIEGKGVLIAIIPGSDSFQRATPFTRENVDERAKRWLSEAGFDTFDKFIGMMKSFQPSLL